MSEQQSSQLSEKSWQDLDFGKPMDAAIILRQSGYFKGVQSIAQAATKIMAGRELGLGSFASMQGFDIVEGKLRATSNLLASMVKKSGRYDYRVREWTDKICKIEFFHLHPNGERESIGFSQFTIQDAERAGLANKNNWRSYPAAMLFARAISNGANAHCPDAMGSGIRVYTEGDHFDADDDQGADLNDRIDAAEAPPAPRKVNVEVVSSTPDGNGTPKPAAEAPKRTRAKKAEPKPEPAPAPVAVAEEEPEPEPDITPTEEFDPADEFDDLFSSGS